MSLYDEYEANNIKTPIKNAHNPGMNFLQTHLRAKKPPPTKTFKTTLAPVIDLENRKKNSNLSKPKKRRKTKTPRSKQVPNVWCIKDEYDPARPNDYYKVRQEVEIWREKERKRKAEERALAAAIEVEMAAKAHEELLKRKELEKQAALVASNKSSKNFLSNYGYDSDDYSGDERENGSNQELSRRRKGKAEFPPPPSLLENNHGNLISPGQGQVNINITGAAVAAKIMAKYGFKEGQGLGKAQQGMSTALQVQRTNGNCGRIVHEKDLMPPPPSKVDIKNSADQDMIELLKNPSRVVLLSNMVGPGEVDEDLETEIKDECNSKYGEVLRVIIYEPSDKDQHPVRVFVEFQRQEMAIKAVIDLNGRFFGGRTVKAQFYDVGLFDASELDENVA